MLEDLIATYGNRLVIAVVGVGIALLCLVVVLRFIRSRGPSPFLRGGRNRQPRLQVLDAAAVDTRRRLVLVRRDDVEHLIMIGGPTDIVVESRIINGGPRLAADYRPADEEDEEQYAPEPVKIAEPRREQLAAARPISVSTQPIEQPVQRAVPVEQPVQQPVQRPLPVEQPVQRSIPVEQPVQRHVESTGPAAEWRQHAEAEVQARDSARNRSVAPAVAADTVSRPLTANRDIAVPVVDPTRDAGTALDAARSRVLAQPTPAVRPIPQTAAAAPLSTPIKPVAASVTTPATPSQRSLGSEFDRILENEMASTLSADKIPALREATTPRPVVASQGQRRPADQPPVITGNAPDQRVMQKEMARIFGENDDK